MRIIRNKLLFNTRRASSVASRASKLCNTQDAGRRTRQGFTLVELVVSMNAAFIVMVTGALLVSSGYRSWNRAFKTANSEARLGALDTMISLGTTGRKSNKMDYCLYTYSSGKYTRITASNPDDVLKGQAIEFRYWDTELDSSLMNPSKTATAYAFFYLENGQLKVDYGPFPIGGPGGVNAAGAISGTATTTITLAQNVTSVEFSHTARNSTGDGNGCIRMKLIITDPTDGTSKTTLAATLMRNTWPQ